MGKNNFRKKLKKGVVKFLNSLLLFFIIFSVAFYPLVFPWSYSSAEESGGAAVIETADSQDSGSPAVEEEKAVEKVSDSDKDATTENKETDAGTAIVETAAADETAPAPAAVLNIEETADPNLVMDIVPQISQNSVENTCTCNDENSTELIPEDCQQPEPENCQCFIDYCQGIVSINDAKEVENTAAAEAVTGENEILGVAENPSDPPAGTEIADNENVAEEDASNKESNEKSATETKNSEEIPADPQTAAIVAGDAVAQVAAVNEINTNIYTDNGQKVVENIEGDYAGDVNLLETFNSILESSKDLYGQNEDSFEKITVANINTAKDVENTVSAVSGSGGNKIMDVDGSASIVSGNASAMASAVNFINTNLTGNNWLFGIVNIFGNWSGDLIVPGEGLLQTPDAKMIFNKIVSINYASNVQNFINAKANTGNNSENSISGDASIEAGDARAQTSAVNLVNTNIVRNNWFFLLINNAGNWMGKAINWDQETGEQQTAYEYEFGSLEGENGTSQGKIVDVYNNNEADQVSNYVIADADSGNNKIENASSASIRTGKADALASAFNFVNTNITGNNWLFGIVNNSGTWTGNVVFGYPDLEVDLSADKDQVQPGENFVYKIKYKNIGKAKCDNAELMFSLPQYLSFLSNTGGDFQNEGQDYYLSAAGLKPGEERTLAIAVKLDENIPQDVISLESSTGIRTETTEKELSNNYENESIQIAFPPTITIENGDYWKEGSSIRVSRSENSQIALGELADHSIKITNTGQDTLYNVVVTEKIKDPSGSTAAQYSWGIEKLKKGQQATIQYQIFLSSPAVLGTYKHIASALGYNEYGYEVQSKKASAKVKLIAGGGNFSTSGEASIPTEAAVQGAETTLLPYVQVVGTQAQDLGGFFRWLWLLLLVIPAYYIWKKRKYEWQRLQKFAQQSANLFSSFF